MLGQVGRDQRIDFLVSPAESLPLAHETFDLLTVSSALHWFERNAFLAEARRVLRPSGWFVVYDNFFSANLHGSPGFKPWFLSMYLERFPTTPRDNRPLDSRSASQAGFQLVTNETYTNVVLFKREQLVDYLLTHTNIIAAIERGNWTLDEVRAYLSTEVSPYFPSQEPRAFDFGGPIILLRKAR